MLARKILRYLLFAIFVYAVSPPAAFSYSKTYNSCKVSGGISADSISKSEIADYRKNFEAVEKMIAARRGNYDDAQRQFNSIRNSRVRNLPEFSGRFSAMQQKLNAWNLEVNPKQPPVVVPNPPSNPPKNTEKTGDRKTKQPENTGAAERKSLMLSYFPDTMTVGTGFLAYVEITKDNTVQFGSRSMNINSGVDTIITGSQAVNSAVTSSQVTVELSRDGGNENFSISQRSDSKTKTVSDNTPARWEWLLQPNSDGEARLRLSVKYQKQNPDGSIEEVPAISKVFVIKGLAKKDISSESNSLPWLIAGVIVLLGLLGFAIFRGRKNRNEQVHRNLER